MIRLLIIARTNRKEIKHLLHPEAVLPVHVDKKTIPGGILLNLMILFALYLITVCSGAIVISFMDYNLITSISTSASIVGNIGPGIIVRPFSDFRPCRSRENGFLLLMLLGRQTWEGNTAFGSFYKKRFRKTLKQLISRHPIPALRSISPEVINHSRSFILPYLNQRQHLQIRGHRSTRVGGIFNHIILIMN